MVKLYAFFADLSIGFLKNFRLTNYEKYAIILKKYIENQRKRHTFYLWYVNLITERFSAQSVPIGIRVIFLRCFRKAGGILCHRISFSE